MRTRYYRYKAENLINVKNIVTVHDFYFDKNFKSQTESHDFWELVYVDEGRLFYNRDGEINAAESGEIIFHKPDVIHALFADGKNSSRVIIISFGCKSAAMSYFENYAGKLSKRLKDYIFEILEESGKIFDLKSSAPETKKMPLKTSAPAGGLQILKNTLELFLIYLLERDTLKADPPVVFLPKKDDAETLISKVKNMLSSAVYESVSVNDICEKTHYSRSYLFREFKNFTGKGIMECYNDLKIAEAKKLLENTDLSVAEISEKLCFDTPSYFCRQFKRLTAKTPLQYRKSNE